MSKHSRIAVLNQIMEIGVIPVFYHPDLETAKKIIAACSAGGLNIIEFTNRGDHAYQVFSELEKYFAVKNPSIILGAGSIIDENSANLYIENGANFIVGPVLNPNVAKTCNRRKVSYSPGCGSATEIMFAEELGVEIVKVFPGDSVGGPNFVKSILGPMPWTNIMPTGGVAATFESMSEWFTAGVAAVGIGSNLIRKDWVNNEDFDFISSKATQLVSYIQEIRNVPVFLGLEHIALYPEPEMNFHTVLDWYKNMFDFDFDIGKSSALIHGMEDGKIEVVKKSDVEKMHIAIKVSNFEKALTIMQSKGVELDEPTIKPEVKSVYIKERDPIGHRVHIIWRK